MRDAGMEVRLDAAGNLLGRRSADAPASPVLMVGSHLDTVPNAGRYDGILGVLLGVAAVKALIGKPLPVAIEVVGFSEEEGVRYKTPYLGSLALTGRFDRTLLNRRDTAGVSMAEAFRSFGLDPDRIGDAGYPAGAIAAYLEAHIEQGPVLEECGLPLGVVSAIAGQSRLWVEFEGKAGHAGTLPMEHRRDPLPAASELVLAVEQLARSIPGLRGTVGSITARPGAINVVPGSATLSIDLRHVVDEVRARAVATLLEQAAEISARRRLGYRVVQAEHHRAVLTDARLAAQLESAMRAAGVEPRPVVSGAGHDAAVMAAAAPVAMLFLRSPGGVSHHPEEAVLRDDVRLALEVMIRFLEAVAQEYRPTDPP
jgi:allantoate deiminase